MSSLPTNTAASSASASGVGVGILSLPFHLPSTTPHATDTIQNHIAALKSSSRRQRLIQGELFGGYIIVPSAIVASHTWLSGLPWGKKLERRELKRQQQQRRREQQEEQHNQQSNESDLTNEQIEQQRNSEFVTSLLTHLQPCPLSIRVTLRSTNRTDDETQFNPDTTWQPGRTPVDTNDDEQQDITATLGGGEEDVLSVSGLDSDSDVDEPSSESLDSNVKSPPTAAAAVSRSHTPRVVSQSQLPSSSFTTPAQTPSNSSTSTLRRPPPSGVAFRRSLPPPPLNASSNQIATNGFIQHHPGRLAPGYAPAYSNTNRSKIEQNQPVWSHAQTDQHAAPSGEETAQPPKAWYFYMPDTHDASEADPSATTPASPSPSSSCHGSLVIFLQCSVSVLPAYLSSTVGLGGGIKQMLAFEVDFIPPPAPQHAALQAATVSLPNSGAFMIEARGGFGSTAQDGYGTLRGFVAANRALQVPHTIPPARCYVHVVDPLVLSSKSVCIGSGVGASHEDGHVGSDIVLELTFKNVSSDLPLILYGVDFILNRSRIFRKSIREGREIDTTTTNSLQRSTNVNVHFLPLGHFFSSTLDQTQFPIRLDPHEQLNVLCFIGAPDRVQQSALEELIRSLLAPSTNGVQSPTAAIATSTMPFRTPFTVRYSIDAFGMSGQTITSQNKVIWRQKPLTTLPTMNDVTNKLSNLPTSFITQPLKLTLHVSVDSPVPMHRTFTIFLRIRNHSTKVTPKLQVVLLPNNHKLVRESLRRREEEMRVEGRNDVTHTRRRHATTTTIGDPFSPTSPSPTLPFTPHATFSPTPASSSSSSSAGGGGDSESDSRSIVEMHFPFRDVSTTINQRARTGGDGTSENDSSAAAGGGGIAMTQIRRTQSSASTFTTTIAQFIGEHNAHEAQQQPDENEQTKNQHATDDDSLYSLLCLETSVSIGSIVGGGDCSVTLHYIALREGMLNLATLFIFDTQSNVYYRPMQIPTIVAVQQ